MKAVTRFSFTQVYLMYGFMTSILIAAIYLITRPDIMLHTAFGSTMGAAYARLMFMIVSLSFFYFNQKYVIKLYVNNNIITIRTLFRRRVYSVSDIQKIDLFARKSLGWLTSQNKSNGISVQTYNQYYFLADIYYRNAPEVKAAIYNNFKPFISNQIYYEDITSKAIYADSSLKKFSGNFLLSINSLPLIISYVVLVIQFQKEVVRYIIWITLFELALLIGLFIFKANYFILSQKQFIVKNQLLRNRNIVFDSNHIESIIIESYYNASNSLRINTKDFHSKSLQAGALSKRTWQKLTESLKEIGIEVQNEL